MNAEVSPQTPTSRAFALVIVLLVAVAAGDTLDVLFLGNSYTYVNDLPALLRELSASGGRTVLTGQNTPGGYTLEGHSTNQQSLDLIAGGGWDFVVLQEQSQIPTVAWWRDSSMYPAARTLDSLVRAQNPGRPCFFITWGRKYGGRQYYGADSSPDFRDFFHMQESLRTAYTRIADELDADLAPVGMAWARARTLVPDVDLWQSDYSHPTIRGSYLAACAFYATLFGETPVGLGFTAGLDTAEARFFQQCAEHAVLGIAEERTAPAVARLGAWPNPFREQVVLDLTGRDQAELVDAGGRVLAVRRGPVRAVWDGRDERGILLAPGVYFARSGTAACRLVRLGR